MSVFWPLQNWFLPIIRHLLAWDHHVTRAFVYKDVSEENFASDIRVENRAGGFIWNFGTYQLTRRRISEVCNFNIRRSDNLKFQLLVGWILRSVDHDSFFAFAGKAQCWIEFQQPWQWQMYMTLVAVSLFVLPALIISGCYTTIVLTIWSKSKALAPSASRGKATTSKVILLLNILKPSGYFTCHQV
jgi:hypothetical protein